MPAREMLEKFFREAGVPFSVRQKQQIEMYVRLLLRWNKKINLTRIIPEEEILRFHFGESFYLTRFFPDPCISLLDVGSGAGFPGMALAIQDPHFKVTLVESTTKKALFLKEVILALGLGERVRVSNLRFEELGEHPEKNYDVVTVRGVKPDLLFLVRAHSHLRFRGRLIITTSRGQGEAVRKKPSPFQWIQEEPIPPAMERVALVGERCST